MSYGVSCDVGMIYVEAVQVTKLAMGFATVLLVSRRVVKSIPLGRKKVVS